MKESSKRNRRIALSAAIAFALVAVLVIATVGVTETNDNYYDIYKIVKENREHSCKNIDENSPGPVPLYIEDAEYSGTNVQTEGIDEGDLVKTDGKYIYSIVPDYGRLDIYLANEGNPEKVSQIKIDGEYTGKEFTIYKDRLILTAVKSAAIDCTTCVSTYDISNPSKPEKIDSLEQSGTLVTTRMDQSYFYTVSRYYPASLEEKNNPDKYIPKAGGKLIAREDIEVPHNSSAYSFMVITAMDVNKPDRYTDKKSVLSTGEDFYMSSDNIYLISYDWRRESGSDITRVSVRKGALEIGKTVNINGRIDSSFSLDEHEGNLRVLTTSYALGGIPYNNVYVLNSKMKIIGSIEKLAKDERIYSARFMGDMGYFVTYRETDPLFAVNFTNPEKPEIVGDLKIPGFSDYMQFYDKNTLIGIGFDGDEAQRHVKLSVFDVSDPTDIKEKDVTVLDKALFTEATENHHTVLLSSKKGIVGFSAGDYKTFTYYLYNYNQDRGFELSKTFNLGNTKYGVRGIYIGDWFYLIQPGKIEAERL